VNQVSKQTKESIIVFVGRVNPDIRDMFDGSGSLVFTSLFYGQTLIIAILIILGIMHYSAVLFYLIDVPLYLLRTYLVNELKNYNLQRINFQSRKKPLLFSESDLD